MTSPLTDSLVGATLGSFRIVRVIGRGGMGTVYLGEHTVIGSKVAIKVLLDRLATDEGLVSRFYAEARAVNMVGHENIVNIFDMNVVPPHRYYLVMEYLEGHPLNSLLTAPVPAEVSIPILVQVCDALQAAHNVSIIHRDLKPENIFLIKRGRAERFVKVLDFGLAKLLDSERDNQHTAAGLIVGTPEFMSPEQANSAPVDGRADIYALGCIAWLLATARLPFPQRGLTDLLVAHRQMMPERPDVVNPAVPKAWADVIMKAIAKKPEDRFQSAAAFAEALDACLGPNTTTVRGSANPEAQRTRPPPPPPDDGGGEADLPPTAKADAAPPQTRHTAQFEAQVFTLDGKSLGTFPCQDISKGGMFLCSEGAMPNVFSRVKVTIPSADDLGLLAEVVRHVPPDQAKAWGMLPGFGVQFVELTPALRDAVGRLIQGLPVKQAAPASSASDPYVEALLLKYRDRVNGDHYSVLGAAANADFPEIRTKATATQKELETGRTSATNDDQRAQLDAALVRVRNAIDVLGKPLSRAEYDANRSNPGGVSRCISAGLSVVELEKLRGQYLAAHPVNAGSAHVKALASKALEAKGQLKEAIDACENALQLDPLNIQLHQRYTALYRRIRETKA